MPQLYANTVEVGDPIPTLQKPPLSRTQISKFAAATGDYGPLHVDEEVARASGYGSVFAHGMIAMAYVGEMLERWIPNGRVLQLNTRFLKFVWPGDVLSAKGVVVPNPDPDPKKNTVTCDVWVQNQNNDKVLQGRATCLLYATSDAEKSHGKGRPDAMLLTADYVSANKKIDLSKAAGGPADKPPPRPPPKAQGTPVAITHLPEAASGAKSKGAKASKAVAKPAKKPASKPSKPAKKKR